MEKFEPKHTPGPWSLADGWKTQQRVPDTDSTPGWNYRRCHVKDVNNRWIAEVTETEAKGFINGSDGEYESNCKLISASPLMLSALIKAVEQVDQSMKDILSFCDEVPVEYPDWYQEAKSAIAAAGVTVKTMEDGNA